MKITIIGASGSGKSTLARKISQDLKIPRFEIDRLWFKYGGHREDNRTIEQKETLLEKIKSELLTFLHRNENWVIDGTYPKIQPLIAERADKIILIKRPLIKRVFSHILRVLKRVDRHPEVTRLQDLKFTGTIFRRWKNKEDMKIKKLSETFNDKLITLNNFKEIDAYSKSLIESISKNL